MIFTTNKILNKKIGQTIGTEQKNKKILLETTNRTNKLLFGSTQDTTINYWESESNYMYFLYSVMWKFDQLYLVSDVKTVLEHDTCMIHGEFRHNYM